MVVDAFPPLEDFGDPHPRTLRHIPCAASTHPSSFFLGPLSALFMAIDSHCRLQDMDCVVFLGTPPRGSQKAPHKPFSAGGCHWKIPKPNSGVMIFNEYFVFVEVFDNRVVSF